MEQIRVLLIEDNPADARFIKELLAKEKNITFEVAWEENLSKGVKHLAAGGIDVILLDLMLPDSRGFDTFSNTQAQAPQIPIVIMTGLDDENLAIRAVRKGAEDYLVKWQMDSALLVHAIRYSIARRLGEEKRFTIQKLKEFDGKEGRPAYVAFKGRVYDISNSVLWKNGIHRGTHLAGNDLTGSMVNAPHSEDILLKFHVTGVLGREKSFMEKLFLKIEGLHPHPILVHFSIAYAIAVSLLSLLYFYIGRRSFETGSYYMLVFGFLAAPVAALSGLFTWRVSYEGEMTGIIVRKIIFTAMLLVIITTCFVWRTLNPDILIAATGLSYIYLMLIWSLVPVVTILGYYGGKIVFD
ncbi:Chemotaxis response regulator protein-glutamate methylesterase [uncultured archaeon]|nr:Chemotaxis response regulator protein-glutamate methylesterase [uncultured archaeon]